VVLCQPFGLLELMEEAPEFVKMCSLEGASDWREENEN
jgi:hypothetical protein